MRRTEGKLQAEPNGISVLREEGARRSGRLEWLREVPAARHRGHNDQAANEEPREDDGQEE
jgi:hypothetical protein